MPKTTDSQPEHLYSREIPSWEKKKNQVISLFGKGGIWFSLRNQGRSELEEGTDNIQEVERIYVPSW